MDDHDGEDTTPEADPSGDTASVEGPASPEDRPLVDLRPALGLAGHEVEELGLEGVPDTGEVLYATEERTNAVQHPMDHVEADIATRGQGH